MLGLYFHLFLEIGFEISLQLFGNHAEWHILQFEIYHYHCTFGILNIF